MGHLPSCDDENGSMRRSSLSDLRGVDFRFNIIGLFGAGDIEVLAMGHKNPVLPACFHK